MTDENLVAQLRQVMQQFMRSFAFSVDITYTIQPNRGGDFYPVRFTYSRAAFEPRNFEHLFSRDAIRHQDLRDETLAYIYERITSDIREHMSRPGTTSWNRTATQTLQDRERQRREARGETTAREAEQVRVMPSRNTGGTAHFYDDPRYIRNVNLSTTEFRNTIRIDNSFWDNGPTIQFRPQEPIRFEPDTELSANDLANFANTTYVRNQVNTVGTESPKEPPVTLESIKEFLKNNLDLKVMVEKHDNEVEVTAELFILDNGDRIMISSDSDAIDLDD